MPKPTIEELLEMPVEEMMKCEQSWLDYIRKKEKEEILVIEELEQ